MGVINKLEAALFILIESKEDSIVEFEKNYRPLRVFDRPWWDPYTDSTPLIY